MKLTVLGANGRTGQLVVEEALSEGWTVTAVVRSEAKRLELHHPNLITAIGDSCSAGFLAEVFADQDAAISTLGGRSPTRQATSVYWRSAEAIAAAAKITHLPRVAVTSSALLFPKRSVMDALLVAMVGNVVESATRMEETLRTAGLSVSIARCGFLTNHATGDYRALPDALPSKGTSIARLGLARFLIDKIRSPEEGTQIYGVSAPA